MSRELTFRNPTSAFRDAISSGVLTKDTAEYYMYMYTDPVHGDAFKNITTRKYVWNNEIRTRFRTRIDYKIR